LGLGTTAAFTTFWIADKFHLSLPKHRKDKQTLGCNYDKKDKIHICSTIGINQFIFSSKRY